MSLKVVPFKSLGAVSYLTSVVTMAVSVAVYDIFNVKEWPDHETWLVENGTIDRSHTSLNTYRKLFALTIRASASINIKP